MAKKPGEKTGKLEFTVDSPTSSNLMEVPSISRLLNRKKLGSTRTNVAQKTATKTKSRGTQTGLSKKKPHTKTEEAVSQAEPISLEPPQEIEIQLDPPSSPPPQEETSRSPKASESSAPQVKEPAEPAAPQIKAATRSIVLPQLAVWDAKKISHSHDPLGKGVALLLKGGATSIVYLKLVPSSKNPAIPCFEGSALAGSLSRKKIWTGLTWDPAIVPELWNYFIKAGMIEFAPPGTSTSQMSTRNIIRSAFGVQAKEYLLLLRAGPEKSCRGVLAVFSDKSISHSVSGALTFLTQKAPQKSAA